MSPCALSQSGAGMGPFWPIRGEYCRCQLGVWAGNYFIWARVWLSPANSDVHLSPGLNLPHDQIFWWLFVKFKYIFIESWTLWFLYFHSADLCYCCDCNIAIMIDVSINITKHHLNKTHNTTIDNPQTFLCATENFHCLSEWRIQSSSTLFKTSIHIRANIFPV